MRAIFNCEKYLILYLCGCWRLKYQTIRKNNTEKLRVNKTWSVIEGFEAWPGRYFSDVTVRWAMGIVGLLSPKECTDV